MARVDRNILLPLHRGAAQQRWRANAPKVVMALNEAGYPCHYEEIQFHSGGWRENVIVFDAPRPPLEVLVKAGEVCGIGDLMERLYDDRGSKGHD